MSRRDSDYDPAVINRALDGLRFPVEVSNAAARITSYCAQFFERLEAVGYEDFRDENPKQTIHLLLQRVQPSALKSKMLQKVKYDPALEKSVPKFIAKLKFEAIACQEYGESVKGGRKLEGAGRTVHNGTRGGNSGERRQNGNGEEQRRSHQRQSHKKGGSKPFMAAEAVAEPPLCLWEKHAAKGIRHFMRDCSDCPDATRKELMADYYARKRTGMGGAKHATQSVKASATIQVFFSPPTLQVMSVRRCALTSELTPISWTPNFWSA